MTTPRDDIAGLIEWLRETFRKTGRTRINEAATQLDSLLKERDELQQVFDSRWEADQRAIKRWQEDHPERKTTWPDHADMVVWLLKERDALQARVKELEGELVDTRKTMVAILGQRGELEYRAVHAEQERDEAYERAAKVADEESALTIRMGNEKPEGPYRNHYYARASEASHIAAEIRRLAAGPEKEG